MGLYERLQSECDFQVQIFQPFGKILFNSLKSGTTESIFLDLLKYLL
jgi:hypothetical protein